MGEGNYDEPAKLVAVDNKLWLLWSRNRGKRAELLLLWRDKGTWAIREVEVSTKNYSAPSDLAVDDDLTVYVAWLSKEYGHTIQYRSFVEGQVGKIHSFKTPGIVRKIFIVPDTTANLLHIVWSSQKQFDGTCEIYHKQVPLPAFETKSTNREGTKLVVLSIVSSVPVTRET